MLLYIRNITFMKKAFILILIILLSILNLSCQRSVLEKPVNPINTIEFSSLTFNMPPLEGINMSTDTSSDILFDHTADIFLFSEGLIELGRLSDREFFTELGHRVISRFYANSNNYTSYSFCDNSSNYDDESPCDENESYNNDIPYIGVAFGVKDVAKHDPNFLKEEHELPSYDEHSHLDCDPKKHGLEECDPNEYLTSSTIAGLYSSTMRGVRDYIENSQIFGSLESIDSALARVNSDPELLLTKCFEATGGFLEETISSILEDTSDIPLEVKSGAINAMRAVEEKIADLQSNLDVAIEQESSQGIVNTFELFFGIKDINSILCSEDTASVDAHPLCESMDLVINLQTLDNLNMVQNFIGWFRGTILEELANGINGILPSIPAMIKNIIISEIERDIDPDNVYNVVFNEARGQAGYKIFKDKATLPGVEFSNVKMMRETDDIISFSVDEDSPLITNGSTLGTAMSALAERLKQMETFEASLYNESKNYQPLFSLFNKSLSMVGHYQLQLVNTNGDGITYREVVPTSFFRPLRFTARQTREESVNPYNYYGDENDGKTQPGYFAIPERLILEEGRARAFAVDLASTQQGNMLSTVASQAELIRGASKILHYLRPDKPSSYDETMGILNLAIGTDNDQAEASATGIDQSLFPKSSFFNLHLGVAGIVLTNLRRNGILIHTLEGESVSGNEFQVGQEGVTPLLISVHDVEEEGNVLENEVKTIDIARLMIAIEEFVLAVKGLDKINTPNLSEFSRRSYKTTSDGATQLKEVILGLHFSMIVELQREDGCFVTNHNIVESRNIKSNGGVYDIENDSKILLDTQVQSLLALTRFYKRSMEEAEAEPDGPQGGVLKRSILKGFSCLTEKLFNSQNQFYVLEEGTNQRPSLRITTDILRLLYKLDFVVSDHANWMQELSDLRTHWTEVYIEQLESIRNALPIPETGARILFPTGFMSGDWMHHQ